MAKRRFTFSSLLPPYAPPRNEWRRRVHAAVLEAQAARGVGYSEGDRLEVRLELYLGGRPLAMMDIDDRVNDVIDALGGHIAGPRSRRKIAPIEARMALGSKMSVAGLTRARLVTPNPTIVRAMVPRLPMSLGFTRAIWSALLSSCA